MAIKRSEQVDTKNGGYYHLISRCVPKALRGAGSSLGIFVVLIAHMVTGTYYCTCYS